MGLGLGVLAALLVLLPGIAFVLGLTRLHNPSKPPTPFDQHFSIGLILAIAAALAFHVVGIFTCNLASSCVRLQSLLQPVE